MNVCLKIISALCLIYVAPTLFAQNGVSVKIVLEPGSLSYPLIANKSSISNSDIQQFELFLLEGNQKIKYPFQVLPGDSTKLVWTIPSNTSSHPVQKTFRFEKVRKSPPPKNILRTIDNGQSLVIVSSSKELLQYNYKTVYPPKGVDTIFKRSGFIHPLRSPSGNVLTRVFPSDHYHHFGLWNPWAKVTVDTDTIDFWNLNRKQGTVRHHQTISSFDGPVATGFTAQIHHVVTRVGKPELIAIREKLAITAFHPQDNRWIMDMQSTLDPAPSLDIVLKMYTYGGLGFRATAEWNNKNSTVLTSEGRTRKDADSTRARWCLVSGDSEMGQSGLLFMSHPSNFNHPEPVRVWPENIYNRGDLFFSFSPTKTSDWKLNAQSPNVLLYRVVVFDGKLSAKEAEILWQQFARPPKMVIN